MGGCLLATLAAAPAHAQYVYEPEVILPPRAVVWRLNDRGFTEITRPRFDGRAYIVEASGPYGDRVRLFVDARNGAILGRERLERPVARIVRPAPGYGWTEEDEGPRRPMREAERLIPPADIPSVPGTMMRRSPAAPPPVLRSEAPERAPLGNPLGNPLGMNPDSKGRPDAPTRAEAPRKVVRLAPPKAAAAPRPAAASPKLSDTPPADSKPAAEPANAALEAPKPTPAAAAPTPTPAAIQPPPAEKTASKDWKDPPADQKRTVRVIGGATIVPGTNAKDESAKDEPAKE